MGEHVFAGPTCAQCGMPSGVAAGSDCPGAPPPPMKRANYIAAPHYFNLNMACRVLTEAWGWHVYLVGSAIRTRDFRDVDVRMILPDEEYEKLFPGLSGNPSLDARWSIICSSISLYLSQHSGLPVDFQIQQQTEANAHSHRQPRHPLGIFLEPER